MKPPVLNLLKISKMALLLGTLSLSSCKEGRHQGGFPLPEVSVVEITPQDIQLEKEYAGRVAGFREVEVRARVSGILLEKKYAEGQKVNQGEVLFIIDPEPFNASLDQAHAKLKDAQARFTQADLDWKRIAALFKEKAVSARERDDALSRFNQARAGVEQAKAEVKSAKINLDYTVVKAPITGITSQEIRSEGSLIGTSPDQSLLTRITQLDPVYVNFAYPDSDMLELRQLSSQQDHNNQKNHEATTILKFGDGSSYKHMGKVNFTDSIIDQKTGSISARAIFDNPDIQLLPGQFVRIFIKDLTRKDAITIPERAIMQSPKGPFVFKLDDKNAALIQPVTLGPLTAQGQIIESGLKKGDKVIFEGMIKVRPNQPVAVPSSNNNPASAPKGS
jgi:membrane fusion protein (multidrug efflux system)